MVIPVTIFALFWLQAAVAQPRYFVEVINPTMSRYVDSADEVKAVMVRGWDVPPSAFTENKDRADYIMRINAEGSNCRWTLVYRDKAKDDDVIVMSKRVIYCWNCPKDLVRAARAHWISIP